MLRRGFTLIEMLLVIGVLGVVSMFSVPAYRTYQARSDLNLATEQTLQGLSRAKLLSQSAEKDSGWGFYVPAGVLYRGAGYAEREGGADEIFPMPSTVSVSGSILDVAYSKLEGRPSATGSIVLTAVDGQQRTIIIEISLNAQQLPAVLVETSSSSVESSSAASSTASSIASSAQSSSVSSGGSGGGSSAPYGQVIICHKPGTHLQQTMTIPQSAWSGHARHGDTQGACSGGQAAGSLCPSRFTLGADGTIHATVALSAIVRVVATELTFGLGGPRIPVMLSYTKNGSKWTSLFSGNAVSSGNVQTVSVAAGADVGVRIRGTYREHGWLLYDETVRTNDGSDHTILLRGGDPLPQYLPYGTQQGLQQIMSPYLDGQGKLTIDASSLIVLVELSRIDFPVPIGEDFQDAVLLLTFNGTPSCP